jgi:hypothetical protein
MIVAQDLVSLEPVVANRAPTIGSPVSLLRKSDGQTDLVRRIRCSLLRLERE